jgi:3-mercaptopropionate dioxygenase
MAQHPLELLDPVRPAGRTPALRRLTRSLDLLVSARLDASTVAARVGMALRPALDDATLLEPRHCEPAEDRYRPHLVHVHPDGLYSILSLVWKPGQATPIHDHQCWCVVGVWRGLERETTYNLHSDNGVPYLLQRHVVETSPGDVSVLVPPDEDIHRVENGGTETAVSVHVYGDDISVLGSSINEQFSDDLIRTRSWSQGTVPVSWRSLSR